MKTPLKLALCALFCLSTAALVVNAEIYFEENFADSKWPPYFFPSVFPFPIFAGRRVVGVGCF
jgi:hypothetical protein